MYPGTYQLFDSRKKIILLIFPTANSLKLPRANYKLTTGLLQTYYRLTTDFTTARLYHRLS